ncbi:MAG: hypothetical protein JNK85_19565 [Verrucomicrobiales bacterium]|nr:hypothetical protein [Verrucomicrobiales bacterium]
MRSIQQRGFFGWLGTIWFQMMIASWLVPTATATAAATPALAPIRFAAVPSHPAGRVDDVVVDGDVAAVMGEFDLQWKNLAAVDRPDYLASLRFELPMRAVAATNGFTYLLTGGTRGSQYIGQFYVIDNRAPSVPRVAGILERTNWFNSDVVIHRGNAYLAAGIDGLHVVDVSNPEAPRLRANLGLGGTAWSVTISSNRACLAVDGSFRVVDISNPDRLLARGGLDLGLLVFGGLASSGSEVLGAGGTEGLIILDVASAPAPRELARLRFPGARASAVSVDGGFAYVSTDTGVQVVDVTTVSAPVAVATISGAARTASVGVGRAYVCDVNLGLVTYDVSTPAAPKRVSIAEPIRSAQGLAVQGHLAFVVDPTTGFHLMDMSHPSAPRYAAHVEVGGRAVAVAASEGRAFVSVEAGRGKGELVIIDTTEPNQPKELRRVDLGSAVGVIYPVLEAEQGHVYVGYLRGTSAAGPTTNRLDIVTISTAGEEAVVAGLDFVGDTAAGAARYPLGDLAVDAGRACLGYGPTLQVLEVAEATNPRVRGSVDVGGVVSGVALQGSRAYVANGTSRVLVVDISDPAQPAKLGEYPVADAAWEVALADETLLYVLGSGGLELLDLRASGRSLGFSVDPRGYWIPRALVIANGTPLAAIGRYGLSAFPSFPGGRTALQVTEGDLALPFTIEATDRLGAGGNWSQILSTNTATLPLEVIDPATRQDARFFRVRQP